MSDPARSVRSMTNSGKPSYHCDACGWSSPKWVGRCGNCQEWASVVELPAAPTLHSPSRTTAAPLPITQVSGGPPRRLRTGVAEFDRVLGGGLVPGSVLLLAGEPGVGKSTLLLAVLGSLARSGSRALYVTGEEAVAQVRDRAERIGVLADELYLAGQAHTQAVARQAAQISPAVLVVDSIATMISDDAAGAAGGVTQLRAASAALIALAKQRELATILVGHVTKDGSIAGPRAMEHLVDVVLEVEGERHQRLRIVRTVKNRYGPTDEVGCFELGDDEVREVADPSGLFLVQRNSPVPGTCVTAVREGRRPLLAEIQALAVSAAGSPRRVTAGMDSARAGLVLAVLERHTGISLAKYDVYLAPVGGARLREPAVDLALALAMFGCVQDVALPLGWLAFGEVGLSGDLRGVGGARSRVSEAARAGITDVVLPRADATAAGEVAGVRLHPASGLAEALLAVPFLPGCQPASSRVTAVGPRALRVVSGEQAQAG
ncbi:MAG: DNA repair protein RadA [Candidatus Nanopelagicales bacterium]